MKQLLQKIKNFFSKYLQEPTEEIVVYSNNNIPDDVMDLLAMPLDEE